MTPTSDDGSDEAGIALAFAAYSTTYLNNDDPDSCEHQNVTTETRYAQATYTMNGVDGHTVTGYPYKHTKCNDCGFTWDDSYSMEQVTVTEPHVNYETWTDYVYGETSYTPDGQDGHKILGITVTCYQCTDCGQYWEGERSTEPVEGYGKHAFKDGKCINCGFENTCAHTNGKQHSQLLNPSVVRTGQNTHTIEGKLVHYLSCDECGVQMVLGSEPATITELHDFSGNTCLECGYMNPCKHEYTSEVISYESATYANGNANGHTVTGLKVYNKVCLNCNRTIQGVYTTESSATEAHEFVDGKCTKCGYVNTCTHAKKSTWEKI